jgi:hypothetical protein
VALAAPSDGSTAVEPAALMDAMVKAVLLPIDEGPLVTRAWEEAGGVRVELSRTDAASLSSSYRLQVVAPGGDEEAVELSWESPGQAATWLPGREESRLARVLDASGRVVARVQLPTRGTDERRDLFPRTQLLQDILKQTGGVEVSLASPPKWLTRAPRGARWPVGWMVSLLSALALMALVASVWASRPPRDPGKKKKAPRLRTR